jgi:serine/threonine protein kinase
LRIFNDYFVIFGKGFGNGVRGAFGWYTSIIIREQMPGIDLENKIKEQKKLTIKEFENILRSSLDPIEEYHSQSISHNDTNVTNLIFNSSDSEKLKPSYIDWETTSKLSIDSSFNKWEQPQEIDFARMFIDIARNVLSNSHSQITPSDMKKVVNECVKYFELDLERTKKAYIGIADHYSPRFISWSYEGLYNNRIPDVRNTCHLLIEDL